jgi:hypothetical protein
VKRLIQFLFALAAIAVPSIAGYQANAAPMAVCKDGKCVIAEEDWKRFQEFHKAVKEATGRVNETIEQLQAQVQSTDAQLARCKSQQADRPI